MELVCFPEVLNLVLKYKKNEFNVYAVKKGTSDWRSLSLKVYLEHR